MQAPVLETGFEMEKHIRSVFKIFSTLNRNFKDTDASFCALIAATHSLIDRTILLSNCTSRPQKQRFGVLAHFPDVFSKLSAKHSSKIEKNISKIHLLWFGARLLILFKIFG